MNNLGIFHFQNLLPEHFCQKVINLTLLILSTQGSNERPVWMNTQSPSLDGVVGGGGGVLIDEPAFVSTQPPGPQGLFIKFGRN